MFPDASYKPFGAHAEDMERGLAQEDGQDLNATKHPVGRCVPLSPSQGAWPREEGPSTWGLLEPAVQQSPSFPSA